MAGIDEKLLAKLGDEGLGNHPDVPKLARELGFKQTKIDSYIQTNHCGGQVGTKGTINLLFDWKKGTRKAQQIPTLRAALIRAGFDELADEYFPVSTETTSCPLPEIASTSSVVPKTEPSSITSPVVQSAVEQSAQPLRNWRNQPRQRQGSARMAANERVTGRQIIFLSQNILPSSYNSLCTHLGFEFAIYDGLRRKHMNDTPSMLVEILNTWAAGEGGGLLWDLDQALIASGSAGLVDRYKDPPHL